MTSAGRRATAEAIAAAWNYRRSPLLCRPGGGRGASRAFGRCWGAAGLAMTRRREKGASRPSLCSRLVAAATRRLPIRSARPQPARQRRAVRQGCARGGDMGWWRPTTAIFRQMSRQLGFVFVGDPDWRRGRKSRFYVLAAPARGGHWRRRRQRRSNSGSGNWIPRLSCGARSRTKPMTAGRGQLLAWRWVVLLPLFHGGCNAKFRCERVRNTSATQCQVNSNLLRNNEGSLSEVLRRRDPISASRLRRKIRTARRTAVACVCTALEPRVSGYGPCIVAQLW